MPNEQQTPWWQSAWDVGNTPLVALPRVPVDANESVQAGQALQQNPGLSSSLAAMGLMGRQGANVGLGTLESMTSPIGLGSMALTGGAGAAGRAGLLGISRAARGAEATLSAPYVAQGAQQAYNAKSIPEALGGAAQAVLGATGAKSALTHSFPANRVARAYMKERKIPFTEPTLVKAVDQKLAARVADAYEDMKHMPKDPKVQHAYAALAKETGEQFEFMIKRAGVKVEKWKGKGEPYKSSAEMLKDVRKKNHLWYLPTETEFGHGAAREGAENPLLAKGRYGIPVNDEFRAIHDYFGHTRYGNSFGPIGEENATRTHARMFSPEARPAMVTETRGQNSWVNFGKHLRRPDGSLPKVGDPDFLPLSERPFAAQKTGLLPAPMSQPEPTLADMLVK